MLAIVLADHRGEFFPRVLPFLGFVIRLSLRFLINPPGRGLFCPGPAVRTCCLVDSPRLGPSSLLGGVGLGSERTSLILSGATLCSQPPCPGRDLQVGFPPSIGMGCFSYPDQRSRR